MMMNEKKNDLQLLKSDEWPLLLRCTFLCFYLLIFAASYWFILKKWWTIRNFHTFLFLYLFDDALSE